MYEDEVAENLKIRKKNHFSKDELIDELPNHMWGAQTNVLDNQNSGYRSRYQIYILYYEKMISFGQVVSSCVEVL